MSAPLFISDQQKDLTNRAKWVIILSTFYFIFESILDLYSRNDFQQGIDLLNTIYFDENGWSSAPEKYTFINFDGMYAPNYYHDINVLDFKISKEGIFPISSDNTHLMISNWNGVFDEMPLTGKYLDVPLIFNPSGDLIVRDTYYVDPLTLRMSKNPKSGYIATRHIYFPKNEMKYQGEYEGRLLFNDLGQDHNVYAYKFTFNALMNIMGDCQSSEYCIVASAKERK